MLLAGLRRRHDFHLAPRGIAVQWREFLASGDLPGRLGPEHYGVMCGSDATGFEYMCAVEVASFDQLPDGTGKVRVATQRYAVFIHPRDSTLNATWQSILAWLPISGYESAHKPDFEVYGEGCDPTAQGTGIEVWVAVNPTQE